MRRDTAKARRHAERERLERPSPEAILIERAKGATRLTSESAGTPSHARCSKRRRGVGARLPRRGAQRPRRSQRFERMGSELGPIADRWARLRLVVIDARRPADDELAAAP